MWAKAKKYVGISFVASVVVFIWALAYSVSAKVVLVSSFAVVVTALLHRLMTFNDNQGGSNVISNGEDAG